MPPSLLLLFSRPSSMWDHGFPDQGSNGKSLCPFQRSNFPLKWLRLAKNCSLITSFFLVKAEILHLQFPPYSLLPDSETREERDRRGGIFSLHSPWKPRLGPAAGDLKAGMVTPVSQLPPASGLGRFDPDVQGLDIELIFLEQ